MLLNLPTNLPFVLVYCVLETLPILKPVSVSGFNDNEICDFVEMTRDKPIDIRFIEYMPFSGNKWDTEKMVSYRLVAQCSSIGSQMNFFFFSFILQRHVVDN